MDRKDRAGAPPPLPEDARIDSLEERLRTAQAREEARTGSKIRKRDDNERIGQKVFSLLIGGILGGCLIGWAVDRLFETNGAGLVIGLVLGIVGGFWSIFRLVSAKPDSGDETLGK